MTMSTSLRSVVKPRRYVVGPELAAWRLSQPLPSHASGPCTRCTTSVIGCSAILAPSKAHPPAAAPGVSGLEQPFLRSFAPLAWFFSHPGSLNTSAILACSASLMASPIEGSGRCLHLGDSDRHRPGVANCSREREASASARDVVGVVGDRGNDRVDVDLVEDLVEQGDQYAQTALVAPGRKAMVMVAIEDRESQANQRRAHIALEVFPVAIADQQIDLLRRE